MVSAKLCVCACVACMSAVQDFIDNKRVKLNAIVGIYPAHSVGDDMELYSEDTAEARKGAPVAKLFGLRQQVRTCFGQHCRTRDRGQVAPVGAAVDSLCAVIDHCLCFVCTAQAEKDGEEHYMCLSDFVSPKGSGVDDYVGMFACSAGHGLEALIAEHKKVRLAVDKPHSACAAVWQAEPSASSAIHAQYLTSTRLSHAYPAGW